MVLKVRATILGSPKTFNPFVSNVPVMGKPGKMCEKHLWKSVSLRKILLFHRCFSYILLV